MTSSDLERQFSKIGARHAPSRSSTLPSTTEAVFLNDKTSLDFFAEAEKIAENLETSKTMRL